MKTSLFLSLFSLISLTTLISPRISFAQANECEPIYGGGQACQTSDNISVEKTIQNPKNGSFVNSLVTNEERLQSGQNVIFRIVIRNTSERDIRNIQVVERLPGIVAYTRGDGTYNKDTREVTLTIDSLAPGQSRTINLTGSLGDLPNGTSNACYANYVQAKAGNQTASDLSQFCIGEASSNSGQSQNGSAIPSPTSKPTLPGQTKGGQTVHPEPKADEVPNTGPELLALIGLIPAAAAGFYLRRKTA